MKKNVKNRTSPEWVTPFLNAQEGLTVSATRKFQKVIYNYYTEYGRTFPWRETTNPYHILVSEFMLQQTQTERVTQKYEQFITTFPGFHSLASASLQKVLSVWSGLGYNRRALNLKKTAEIVVTHYSSVLPSSPDVLMTFPGIGKATAGAVAAFAFGNPVAFVETNIRTVFIYFFFRGKNDVKDKEILPLVEKTLDYTNPREWYYALMDYGVMLKKQYRNLGRKSAHYTKQAPFTGSDRQMRGMILKTLLESVCMTEPELIKILCATPGRVKKILAQLEREGFISREGTAITIA